MAGQPPTAEALSRLPTDEDLERLEWASLDYYLKEVNLENGLVRDKTDPAAPASIAAVGMALAAVPVFVEGGVVPREFGAQVALNHLRFFSTSAHGPEPDATGYKGFYYHFLDFESGRRVWNWELSTIDSAFLFAGMLTVATYFDRDTAEEAEVRRLANALYERADWDWARDGGPTLSHVRDSKMAPQIIDIGVKAESAPFTTVALTRLGSSRK